jgi:glycosyltransferase involved in cell wall biosynthesis
MSSIRHIVYKCLPGAFTGGVQKMAFELASAQRRLGAEVEVWTPDEARAGTVQVFEGLPVRYFKPDMAFGYAKSTAMVEGIASLPKNSVVHGHSTFHPLNLQVGRAARRHRHRAFNHPHGALSPIWMGGYGLQALKKRLYVRVFEAPNLAAASGVFALTEVERRDLANLGVDAPLHLLPNGITPVMVADAVAGQEFRRKHGVPSAAPAILFIGRIVPLKKIEDMIAAVAILEKAYPDLRLIVAGAPLYGDDYLAKLRSRVVALGLASRVHWVGFLNETEKRAAYAASQSFIHASESEGMSISILEAMSAGLPVVASQGCNMAPAARAGALVEFSAGPEALAAALSPLLADLSAARAQGDAGRSYVGTIHDWAAIARAALRIYDGQAGRG